MSNENETTPSEMSLSEVDEVLFSEAQALEQAPPEPNVTELLQQAGLQRQSPQPPQETPPAEAPQGEALTEQPPAIEQSPDAMQQFVEQQGQINQQMVELQQQFAQMQKPQQKPQQQQFDINNVQQVSDYMEQIGLDPTDSSHQFLCRSDWERRQNEATYQQQIQGMNEYITYMQNQQQQQAAETTVAPQIESTLKPYGGIPPETIDNIKAHAATLMSHGQYNQAQAIQAAVEPYLPLLKIIQQSQSQQQAAATPQPAQAQQPPQNNTQAVLAAALSGRSTGHGPTVSDISLEDLEGKLFS